MRIRGWTALASSWVRTPARACLRQYPHRSTTTMSALLKNLKHSMVALAIGCGATLGLTASGAAQADARAVVFVGNNGKAPSGIASAGRFNGGIERKQVGLVCYV